MSLQNRMDSADRLFLKSAIELAEHGMFSVTANPRVGCLLVKSGQVIGRGYHQRAGEGHAEANALANARQSNSAQDIAGATAYVSLEPCCHAGRTPACTDALIDAGIARVVVALLDPHPKVAGEGLGLLRAAGIRVDVADETEQAAARRLNPGHIKCMLHGRPYVRIKIAQSLDGRTAMASGESKWITGPVARRDVQYWRARSGAVLTGVGTVLADDPALTVRDHRLGALIGGQQVLRQPLRVVLDSLGRATPESTLFTDDHPTLWVVGPDSDVGLLEPPKELLMASVIDNRVDIDAVLAELANRGCNEVLVEAGSQIVGEFLRRDIWDELLVYTAPKLLGSDARPTAGLHLSSMSQAIEAKIAAVDQVGTDVRTRLVRPETNLDALDCMPLGVPEGFLDAAPGA